ncbi:methyltransferase [Holotrichia oblita]|uniref:Methyltransferase n=1 Tax=Holotrichia oblita TaxID=644536 RepID=A0ACB9TKP6_HOLOL|nr:methyltransferase [Holotrichia oblita]
MLKTVEKLIIKWKSILPNSLRSLATTTTIDERELKNFEKHSESWWDQSNEGNALHSMNFLRVPFIRDGLIDTCLVNEKYRDTAVPLTGLKILDVGCGGGYLSEPLARLGGEVVGIDASNNLVTIAREHAGKDKTLNNLTYMVSSIEDFSSKNLEIFDAVVASEVIEHVNDQSRFVNECVKCLKPDGSIFLTTINKTFLSKLFAICVAETMGIVPVGTHEYDKFIEPHILQRMLEDSNCCTRIIHGMFYNYLTNNWSWVSDTSICYATHAVKVSS